MPIWNPWHGCTKYSAGCQNCYVYRIDATHGHNSTTVQKTAAFALPMQRTRGGTLKLQPTGEPVYTCLSSDFFLPDADNWRPDIWAMIRYRSDLQFFIITKRLLRAAACLPPDWGTGYPNVTICCTTENQQAADERLPVLLQLPIAKKEIICEPLLTPIQLQPYLQPQISRVTVGGESGEQARLCRWEWVTSLAAQCRAANVPFVFKQTGARFEKEGICYKIPRRLQQIQAQKAMQFL